MSLWDVVKGIRNYGFKSPLQRDPSLPVDAVPDRQLENLRRMRTAQLQEMEKRNLQRVLKEHQRKRSASGIIGPSPFNGSAFGLRPEKNLIMKSRRMQ